MMIILTSRGDYEAVVITANVYGGTAQAPSAVLDTFHVLYDTRSDGGGNRLGKVELAQGHTINTEPRGALGPRDSRALDTFHLICKLTQRQQPACNLPSSSHDIIQQLLPGTPRGDMLTGSLLWGGGGGGVERGRGCCPNPGHTTTLRCLPSPHLKLPERRAWVCCVCCCTPGV